MVMIMFFSVLTFFFVDSQSPLYTVFVFLFSFIFIRFFENRVFKPTAGMCIELILRDLFFFVYLLFITRILRPNLYCLCLQRHRHSRHHHRHHQDPCRHMVKPQCFCREKCFWQLLF